MTQKNTGNYAAKHKPDMKADERLAEAIKRKADDGALTCAQASRISDSMKVEMGIIGVTLDLMEIRIGKCQLGLFGHGKNDKTVKPAKTIRWDIEEAIRGALVNNRLSCAAAWDIAGTFGVPKMRVSSICEALKIKIKPCQLGAF
jgi:hypothetical protein